MRYIREIVFWAGLAVLAILYLVYWPLLRITCRLFPDVDDDVLPRQKG